MGISNMINDTMRNYLYPLINESTLILFALILIPLMIYSITILFKKENEGNKKVKFAKGVFVTILIITIIGLILGILGDDWFPNQIIYLVLIILSSLFIWLICRLNFSRGKIERIITKTILILLTLITALCFLLWISVSGMSRIF